MDPGTEAPLARPVGGRRKVTRNSSGGIKQLLVHKPEPRMTHVQGRKSFLRSSNTPENMTPAPKQHPNEHPTSASRSSTLFQLGSVENIAPSPVAADQHEPPFTAYLSPNVTTNSSASVSGLLNKCATSTVSTQVEHEDMHPDHIFLKTIRPEMHKMNTRQKICFKMKINNALKEVFDDAKDFPVSESIRAPKQAPETAATNSEQGLPRHSFVMPGQNSTPNKLADKTVNAQSAFSGRILTAPTVSNNGGVIFFTPEMQRLGQFKPNCGSVKTNSQKAAEFKSKLIKRRLTLASQYDLPYQRPRLSTECNATVIKRNP